MKLEQGLEWLKDDAKQYPVDDPTGYYTTVDIIRIFPEIKMETIQDWIKRGFFKPKFIIKIGLGDKKFFVRSQLCMIGLFKKLVDLGIHREYAKTWIRAFHNKRVDLFKNHDLEPDFVILEIEQKEIKALTVLNGEIEIKQNVKGRDLVIINFHRVINQIDSYSKG